MVFKTYVLFNDLADVIDEIIAEIDACRFKEARWFRKKADRIKGLKILDYTVLASSAGEELIIPLIVSFQLVNSVNGHEYKEIYYLPLIISKELNEKGTLLLKIEHPDYCAFVSDGVHSLSYNQALDRFIRTGQSIEMKKGGFLKARLLAGDKITRTGSLTDLSSNSLTLVRKEQIVKTYRKLVEGINPDIEIGRLLYEETTFRNFPRIMGYISYHDNDGREYCLCLQEEFVVNQGDLWVYTQKFLAGYLDYARINSDRELLLNYIEDFSSEMVRLGTLIAELHLALASINREGFKPAGIDETELKEWYRTMKENVQELLGYLRKNEGVKGPGGEVLKLKEAIYTSIKKVFSLKGHLGKKIRIHGDLHLEQILKTGDTFLVLDFEGEPLKEPVACRQKHPSLKDVAGMLRSFNYAAHSALFNYLDNNYLEGMPSLKEAVLIWEREVVKNFVTGYINRVRDRRADLLPPVAKFNQALALFKLDKALYEALYEINNRPDWLPIPLQGILGCIRELETKEDTVNERY